MSNGDDEYHDTTARGFIVILGCSAIISAICSPSGRGQRCGEPEPDLIPLTVKPVHLHIKGIINTLQTAKHIMPGSESHNTHTQPQALSNKHTRTRWVHKNPVSGLKDEPTTTAMRYWRAPFARAPQASNLHALRHVATLHSSYLIAPRQEQVSLEPR